MKSQAKRVARRSASASLEARLNLKSTHSSKLSSTDPPIGLIPHIRRMDLILPLAQW
jgi:hypothetical protein